MELLWNQIGDYKCTCAAHALNVGGFFFVEVMMICLVHSDASFPSDKTVVQVLYIFTAVLQDKQFSTLRK